MKRAMISLGAIVFGVLVLAPVGSVNAHYYQKNKSHKNFHSLAYQRVCDRFEDKELRAWENFDQSEWRSRFRVQLRVDLQHKYGCDADETIADLLSERSQFSTLAAALSQAGLLETFTADGNLTLFAPTDDAFEKLGKDTINAVLADQDLLSNILSYHVVDPEAVPDAVPSRLAVQLDSAPMLNGDTVDIRFRNGQIYLNDAKVVVRDLKASNGIVHVIDAVLVP